MREKLAPVIGIIAGLLTYLLAAKPIMEWGYYEWLAGLGYAISVVSAVYFPRPESKGPGINPARFVGLLLVGTIGLSLAQAGCTALPSPLTLPTVQALSAKDLAEVAARATQAGQVAEGAQQVEIGLYRSGVVPADTHRAIQQGFLTTAESMKALLTVLSTTKDPQKATALLQTIARELDRLSLDAKAIPSEKARSTLVGMIDVIRSVLGIAQLTA